MKGIIKLVVVIIVAASAVGIGVTVVNNVVDSPKKTIAKMEEAYNSLDVDAFIECYDPTVQAIYSGANSLMGEFFGMDISDIAALAPFLSEYDEDFDASDFPKISIKVTDVDKTSDTTATVYCDIKYSTGEEITNEEIDMVKIDGEWYISGEGLF